MKHKTALPILLALLGWFLNAALPARAQERELALEKILNPLPEFDPFEKPPAAPLFFPDEADKRARDALVDALTNRKDALENHLRFFKDEDMRQQKQHGSATGSPHVADPLPVIAEHRHQVPLSIDDGHDQGQREGPPRLSSGHFQCDEVVRGDTRRGHSSRRSIYNPRNPVGSLPTVQPSSEVSSSHQNRSAFWSLCLTSNQEYAEQYIPVNEDNRVVEFSP